MVLRALELGAVGRSLKRLTAAPPVVQLSASTDENRQKTDAGPAEARPLEAKCSILFTADPAFTRHSVCNQSRRTSVLSEEFAMAKLVRIVIQLPMDLK